MKRVLAICLVVLMALSMSVTAFAAPEGFVNSPSRNPAPGVVTFDPADDNCVAQLIITAFAQRDNLPDAFRALLEAAYNAIMNAVNLTDLNADLGALAANQNINGEDLAVSDLFNLHTTDCDEHDGHVAFDVVLEADTLRNFVGLMYMNSNGQWVLVEDAQVVNNGEHLQFTLDAMEASNPFAIVVNTGDSGSQGGSQGGTEGDNAQTDDLNYNHIYIIVMGVAAAALIVLLIVSKKKKA